MIDTPGVPFVLTAPLTESVDHAGFFIQMSLASIPEWMEWVIDKKYPSWRNVPTNTDGSAETAPAGLRVLEAVLVREFGRHHVVVCYPEQLPQFVGIATESSWCRRTILSVRRSPLGVYASIFERRASRSTRCTPAGCSARSASVRSHPFLSFSGVPGAWQIEETGTQAALGDRYSGDRSCGERRRHQPVARALAGELLPPRVDAHHPHAAGELLVPEAALIWSHRRRGLRSGDARSVGLI
jgi:hypothetical protein